jgi:hypothetical protein
LENYIPSLSSSSLTFALRPSPAAGSVGGTENFVRARPLPSESGLDLAENFVFFKRIGRIRHRQLRTRQKDNELSGLSLTKQVIRNAEMLKFNWKMLHFFY